MKSMTQVDPVEAFIFEISDIEKRHEGVLSGFEDDDGQIYMTGIEANPQGQGIGTAFMHEVEALLDLLDLTIKLEPTDSDLDESRLGRWYARHGFEWIGQHRMHHQPRSGRIPSTLQDV